MREGEPAREESPPPSPDSADRANARRIVALLEAAADPTGFIAFDRFMDLSLYAPEVGYYSRPRSPLGTSGDFYTAPAVHPVFGRTLAGRVRAVRGRLAPDRPFRLVEVGPGDGTLGAVLGEALGEAGPVTDGWEVVLVERSSERGPAALDRVRVAAERLGIPTRLIGSIGELGPFDGVVVANELLDAQPARRLEWTGTEWHELGVRVLGDRVEEARSAEVRPIPSPALPVPEEPGTVLEVSPAAQSLVREVADHLVRGELIVLDYGMEEDELVRGHPGGTLAAVRAHRTGLDPLACPGSADLSTFVNFTRFRDAARRAGLEVVSDRSQAEALEAWGLRDRLDEAVRAAGSDEAELRLRLAVKNLLFGFERFRALELAPPESSAMLRSPPT